MTACTLAPIDRRAWFTWFHEQQKMKHTQKERGRKHQCLKSEDINIAMGQTVLAFAAVCSRSRCKSSKCVRCSSVFSCASSIYFDSYSLPHINRRLSFTTVADRYDLLLRGDRSQITAVLTKRSRGSAEHAPSGQTRRRQHPDRTHVPPRALSQHSNVAYNLCVIDRPPSLSNPLPSM